MIIDKRKCATCPSLVEVEIELSDNNNSVNVICEDCARNMIPYDASAYNSIFEIGE